MIDLCTINDAGNLIDACGLAAMAALKEARFPGYENNELDYQNRTNRKIEILKEPIPITVCKLKDQLFIDALREEEEVIDARLTITTTTDGKICSLQKGGSVPLTIEDIDKMIAIAEKNAAKLRKKLK